MMLKNLINYWKMLKRLASINQMIMFSAGETTIIIFIVQGKSIETPEGEQPNWDLVSVGTVNS